MIETKETLTLTRYERRRGWCVGEILRHDGMGRDEGRGGVVGRKVDFDDLGRIWRGEQGRRERVWGVELVA